MSEIERTRKSAYEQVDGYILNETVGGFGTLAVQEQTLKTTLCANGSLSPGQVDTALKALGEQEKIQYGAGWIVPIVNKTYHKRAIAWLANRDEPPRELIGHMNKTLQNHDWHEHD
jgi:hypothetical protein